MSTNNLRKIRKEKGLSGLELSRRARIAPNALSLLERGYLPAYPNWRKRCAQALGVEEDVLFPEEEAQAEQRAII